MNPDERSLLIDSLLEGQISEADLLRLEAELTVDAEVRQEYYRRLQLDLLLEREASEAPGDWDADITVQALTKAQTDSRRITWVAMVALATAACLLIATSWMLSRDRENTNQSTAGIIAAATVPQASSTEPSANGFAVLSGQSGAVWDGDPIGNGALVPEGKLHLKSGLVHLELFSGVQMVIQGDALFSVDSPMQVSLVRGRARAHVPEPAHGFRVKTASGEVVDLGTEFTVDVDQDSARVKVVDGEVELQSTDALTRRLTDGQAMQLTAAGFADHLPQEELNLLGPAAFQNELAQLQSNQFSNWQQSRERLRLDPRLIAYYQVNPDAGWSRQLVNQAAANPNAAGDGAVVAAERTEDRWGRNQGALDFSPMGSRVRVSVPGEHRGLTLCCWVKINSLDRWYNSLFLTDGHESGEPHWQIMNDGRLFFSVKPPDSDQLDPQLLQQQIFYSDPFWDTSLSGRWIMLTTVLDVDRKRVSHYLNDRSIGSHHVPEALLVDSVKIGSASICNWSEPMYRTDAKFVVRNLNGSMDEFALFSGALSEQEIKDLFQTGNPHEH
ncbi:FecR domain-containing protein [Stieleria sp. TO1_6]|uniref:FecR domain-containing protein n=1 Tax=Stieleria tagensis TaxID=2956795 RepID=UPI00209B42AD|nr:FecR domain-containing protein [Stieleria tagensis]MCO8124028.1 FecR domain-containing protein [Stieleria tagensis]